MNKIDRAYLSLEGLALGDAFGQRFFGEDDAMTDLINHRVVPDAPWTDG